MGNAAIAIGIALVWSIPAIFDQQFFERMYERREKKRKARILERLLSSK